MARTTHTRISLESKKKLAEIAKMERRDQSVVLDMILEQAYASRKASVA